MGQYADSTISITNILGYLKGCMENPETRGKTFDIGGPDVVAYRDLFRIFTKEAGFFSTLLSEVVDKRKKYKKEYNAEKNAMTKARSNAYKLLANASFGYQGFFGARYYSREAAASTLAFVRKYTHDTMDRIEKAGYTIIYGDTDSIAFLSAGKSNKDNGTIRFTRLSHQFGQFNHNRHTAGIIIRTVMDLSGISFAYIRPSQTKMIIMRTDHH